MLRTIAVALAIIVLILIAAMLYGKHKWQTDTTLLRARLLENRNTLKINNFDTLAVVQLPVPVQRFFRFCLAQGQKSIEVVRIEHEGFFNMGKDHDDWKPFTSTQVTVVSKPGFDWDARVKMAPCVTAYVHDAYAEEKGILYAQAMALFTVMDLRGTSDIAFGELMRFFAEMVWYPTALLPGNGVEWEAIDDSSALAHFSDGNIKMSLRFFFAQDGSVKSVLASARGRLVANESIPTPWQITVSNYQLCNGIRIPTDADVAWILPEGTKSYWRGHIAKIEYEFSK